MASRFGGKILRALKGRFGSLTVGLLVTAVLLLALPVLAQTGKKPEPGKKPQPKVVVDRDALVPGLPGAEMVAFIDEQLEKLWAANKVQPAERCSDYEFIRRASLDIIGRIATVEEINQFLKDPSHLRRSLLIERLLNSDDYASHFANLWTTLLLTRSAGKTYRDQMHLWLFDQFEKVSCDWSDVVTKLLTATGRTNENGAVNFLLMHLGEEIPANNRVEMGRFDMVPATSRITRLFLGLRTQCTQCHDHPFNDEWQQSHFWGMNAFLRQIDAPAGRPQLMPGMKKQALGAQFELTDNPSFNNAKDSEGIVSFERRIGLIKYTQATFLDGTKIPRQLPPDTTRRKELAKLIIKSEYFAKAFVNRMWGHFFGKSFTKDAEDDFGEHNSPSAPELLDKLAKEWATKYDHNPRHLIRWICNSRAYGLSAVANKTNSAPETEVLFSRMLLKAMTPEQLFESLMTATQSKAAQNREDRRKKRDEWLNKLVVSFGDDEGRETTFNGTVIQALILMNGQEINEAIMDKEFGTVANVLKKPGITPKAAMADLFLAALNRPPTEQEYAKLLSPKMINLPRLPPPNSPQARQNFYTGVYQDLFWAILNSNEFFLNH